MISRRGFTLIELLVVVAIMAMLMAIGFSLSSGDRRDPEVRAAANELASVLRKARAMAMDRRAVHAVVFNIANPLGASGKVLSNRTGGHWYRILGPSEENYDMGNNGSPTIPLPDRRNNGSGPGYSDDENYGASGFRVRRIARAGGHEVESTEM